MTTFYPLDTIRFRQQGIYNKTQYYRFFLLIVNYIFSRDCQTRQNPFHLGTTPATRPARGIRFTLPGTGSRSSEPMRLEFRLLLHVPQPKSRSHTERSAQQSTARPFTGHRCRSHQRPDHYSVLGSQHSAQEQEHARRSPIHRIR